jgi:hypothetical protein
MVDGHLWCGKMCGFLCGEECDPVCQPIRKIVQVLSFEYYGNVYVCVAVDCLLYRFPMLYCGVEEVLYYRLSIPGLDSSTLTQSLSDFSLAIYQLTQILLDSSWS